MTKHAIVGWGVPYAPVNSHNLGLNGPDFYWVTCTCGDLITGWNEAVVLGKAKSHLLRKYGSAVPGKEYGKEYTKERTSRAEVTTKGVTAHMPKVAILRAVVQCHEAIVLVSHTNQSATTEATGPWVIQCDIGNFAMSNFYSFNESVPKYSDAIFIASWLAEQACEFSQQHEDLLARHKTIQEQLRERAHQ